MQLVSIGLLRYVWLSKDVVHCYSETMSSDVNPLDLGSTSDLWGNMWLLYICSGPLTVNNSCSK